MAPSNPSSTTHAGHVSRCSAGDCGFNRNGDCAAPNGIFVVRHGDHADCGTYTNTQHRVAGTAAQPPAP